MGNRSGIIAVTGDVGGACALLPVLCELRRRKTEFSLVDHGMISEKADKNWNRISEETASKVINSSDAELLVFTTSIRDNFPLKLARAARKNGIKVLCLLDNWMNYRFRMEIDGEGFFIPDLFLVMDDYARAEAITDGFPSDKVLVTGQPALASLAKEYEKSNKLHLAGNGKKGILFISEPVELDQGRSVSENPNFRGYTEKTVLRLLIRSLKSRSSEFSLHIASHPREDKKALKDFWNSNASGLEGGIIETMRGREAVFGCDAAAGMASILLYEASLLGKPALSIQPNLRNPQLAFLKCAKGVTFTSGSEEEAEADISEWISKLREGKKMTSNTELKKHENATKTIADIIAKHLR